MHHRFASFDGFFSVCLPLIRSCLFTSTKHTPRKHVHYCAKVPVHVISSMAVCVILFELIFVDLSKSTFAFSIGTCDLSLCGNWFECEAKVSCPSPGRRLCHHLGILHKACAEWWCHGRTADGYMSLGLWLEHWLDSRRDRSLYLYHDTAWRQMGNAYLSAS